MPIHTYGLSPYVILHGAKHGKELDVLFEKADFAVGSLARHRSGIQNIKTLKTGNMQHEVSDSFIQKQTMILKKCLIY